MAEKIVISDLAQAKLDGLVDILVEKGYFAFLDSAENYVRNIYRVIYDLPQQHRHPTNQKKYGAWYCKYKPNRNTTWYITFDTDNEIWVVRNIINNHTSDYPAFIRSI